MCSSTVCTLSENCQRNMAISVGYVGTHGLHLFGDEFRSYDHVPTAVRQQLRTHINDSVPTPAPLVATYGDTMPLALLDRPYPQYQNLGINSNPDGFNRYNALQTRFEKRYSNGLSMMVAYTHQKNIGSPNTGSIIGNTATATTIGRAVGRSSLVAGGLSGGSGGAGGASAQDPDNRNKDVALTADDIPNVLNIAGTYELPVGRGKPFLSGNGIVAKLLGGWSLSQNWNFQNGVPLVITAPCNGIQSEIGICRPNLIGDPNKFSGSRSKIDRENQWLNPNAFQAAFKRTQRSRLRQIPLFTTNGGSSGTWASTMARSDRPASGMRICLSPRTFISLSSVISASGGMCITRLNHQNLGIPNTNWCLAPNSDGSTDLVHQFGCQFGKITNIQTDPRAMQFALKFYF